MGKWEMAQIGNVISDTITGEWGEEPKNSTGTNVLRTTNFTNRGVIDFANVVVRDIPLVKVDKKKLFPGDIILEKSGGSDNQPVGRVVYFDKIDGVYLCNNFTQILRINPTIAHSKYVFYFLFNCHRVGVTELMQNKTTGIRNLQVKSYLGMDMPLPPLPAQQKIADILDRASTLIEKRKAQIAKLDLLVKSQFIAMFGDPVQNPIGWEVKKVGELGNVGSSKRVFTTEFTEAGVPFYRGTEVAQLSLGEHIEPKYHISKEHYEQLREATGVPKIGDLLLPSICAKGEVWRVSDETPFYFKDGRVLWVSIEKNDVSSEYLRFALREKLIRDFDSISSGSTFAELKIFLLKDIDLIIPDLLLQNRFAAFVTEVEKSKAQMQQALVQQELLYKSLMQKCFNGEMF